MTNRFKAARAAARATKVVPRSARDSSALPASGYAVSSVEFDNGHAAPDPLAERGTALPSVDVHTAGELDTISVKSIDLNPLNPRKTIDDAELQELATSIREKGVLEPILVRPHPNRGCREAYQLVAGERRFRAAVLAGLLVVPAIIRNFDDRACLEAMIVENEQRSDVAPLEKAAGYDRLIKQFKVSIDDLARRIGKSVVTIRQLLKLRQLPEVARKAVEDGRLPASTAIEIARVPTEKLRQKVALHVISGVDWFQTTPRIAADSTPMTRKEAQAFIHEHCQIELSKAPFDTKDVMLDPVAGSCETCPNRAGNAAKEDPEGFKGIRGDMCLDLDCYHAKVKANQEAIAGQAKANGAKVMPQKDSDPLFNWGDGSTLYYHHAQFVDLADPVPDSRKKATFAKLLGEDLKEDRVIAFDRKGHPHTLVPKDKAMKALAKSGALDKVAAVRNEEQLRQKEEDAKRRKEQEVVKAAALVAMGCVSEQFEDECKRLGKNVPNRLLDNFGLIFDALFELVDSTYFMKPLLQQIEKRRGLAPGFLRKSIELLSFGELMGLLAELAAAHQASTWVQHREEDINDAFFEALGIDRKAMIKEVSEAKSPERKKAARQAAKALK